MAREALFRRKPATVAAKLARTGRLAFEPLESRLVLDAGPLVISEFMAVNDATLADADGDFSDWIEIHNPTGAAVSLNGWYLTDDNTDLTKWQFPAISLSADDYLLVFASGKDLSDPAAELHTNFQLDGAGEYLALVRADGTTVASQFSPEFPEQFEDVSYGMTQDGAALALGVAGLNYLVPTAAEGPLGTTWTAPGFDDSTWTPVTPPTSVLITEAGTGEPDFVEIQNLSGETVDTSGWVVAVNNADDREHPADINAWHSTLWNLPASMTADEVLYRSDIDDHTGNYWGDIIFWRTNGPGWAMLLDDNGNVVDFVVWDYSSAEINSLDVTINGHHVTAAGLWTGAAVVPNGTTRDSLQRGGTADHNTIEDWSVATPISMGSQNDGLTVPLPHDAALAIGFEANPPGLSGAVEVDVEQAMHNVNASLWMRMPFQVDNPAVFDSMQLRMNYNDGFVAYLNGREIARPNAPAPAEWNSHATAARNVADSLVVEEIDVSGSLVALQAGTNVLAVHGLNVSAGDDNFLIRPELAVTSMRYFAEPTPGDPNTTPGFLGVVKDTNFSIDRGLYDEPLDVVIATDTDGAQIRYTTDGSEPAATAGSAYAGPITISTTTTLRAAAFNANWIPTNIDTQTYIFPDDVIYQDGAGYPTNWGHTGNGDYEVDPYVVGLAPFVDDNAEQFSVQDALQAVPTLSLVMDQDYWFGSETWTGPGGGYEGIYRWADAADDGGWERPVSAELIYPDHTEGFQLNCSVRIIGGSSPNNWKMDKLSLRLKFQRDFGEADQPEYRPRWGPANLDFPLFGDEATDRFDTIVLDARMNQTWAYGGGSSPDYQREHAQYTRDQFVADIQDAMDGYAPHGISAHVYINGLYWGLYRLHERPDEHFAQAYLGGDDDDYGAIKHNENTIIHPDVNEDPDGYYAVRNDYRAMHNVAQAGLSGDAQYQLIQEYLDVPDFIDYMITNFYVGNTDWAHQNWYATRNMVDPDGRWRYHSWDAEHVMKNLGHNNTGRDDGYGSPTFLHQRLRANQEYRVLFADHVHRHFFNDGILTTDEITALYQIRLDEVDRAVVGESARWGDNQEDRSSTTYLRDPHWLAERDRLLDTYFPQRSNIVLDQFRARNLYPDVDAPTFSLHGGEVEPGFELTISAPSGTIYYTLDGSDPRLSGGAVNWASAEVYSGNPIVLSEPTTVKARVLDGGTWSALNGAYFFVGEPAGAGNLAITELNYNPYEPTAAELAVDPDFESSDFEFIELRNTSDAAINLRGVRMITGVDFDFTGSNVDKLTPGQFVVVARNAVAFQARYGGQIALAGQYDGKFSNGGERIQLTDRFGQPIFNFSYNDAGAWPGRADGKGASLELISPDDVPVDEPQRTVYLEDGDHWRSSSEYGGSPGSAGTGPLGDVVVNEVLTRTPMDTTLDQIELHNTTDAAIDLDGWYLSDSWGWESNPNNGNYKKFRIPDGTTIPALGYLVLDEDDFNPGRGTLPNDFALSGAHGDDVWLIEADATEKLTRFVDHVEFGATAEGESWGRWPSAAGDFYFYPMIRPTFDTADGANSGPRLGQVILSEVNYHPAIGRPDNDLEFVEIYNATGRTVDLTDWRIRGGVDYDFPAGTTLAAYSPLVVVPFELSETAKWSAFCEEYGLDVQQTEGFLGGYDGQLDNGADRVRLQRPGVPPLDEPDFIPGLLEDELRYDDEAPWPVDADGGGPSLHRVETDTWGDTHPSWEALVPTPGQTTFVPGEDAEVVGRYVFYNRSAFDGNDAAADARDDDAIAPDKEALLPGGTATLANYTSYSRGINGIMIDIDGMAEFAEPGVDDFQFCIGNSDAPGSWAAGPSPSSITVRAGAGIDGSDRVTILWPEGAIQKQWLQVTVLTTDITRLPEEDVFYFGNAIGESGNTTTDAKVNATDMLAARNHQRTFINPAPIDFAFDYDRDARVNATDVLIARNHQTNFLTALNLIHVPPGKAGEEASVVGAISAYDAVFQQALFGESGLQETSLGKWAWVYQFEQPSRQDRPSEQGNPAEKAVERLLAGFWP